jgi:hypothetical protein
MYTSCSSPSNLVLPPYDFTDSSLTFRFVDVNLNQTIDLCGEDFFLIPGFLKTDSVSRINIPRNKLTGLFAFNINIYDLLVENFTKMRYCMDKTYWNTLTFSDSVVIKEKAINPNIKYQQLKYDLTRYFIKTITSSIYQNGLFRNKNVVIEKITELDASFNESIVSIINLCGTSKIPKSTSTYTNNPSRVLIESIIEQDNVLGTDNFDRKTDLVTYMNSSFLVSTSLCVRGIKVGTINNRYFQPLKVIKTGQFINEYKFTTIYDTSGVILNDASYNTFYGSTADLAGEVSNPLIGNGAPTVINYEDLYNKFIPFIFNYGDSISVRLNYKPTNNLFMGKLINDRSYEIYIDAGLDVSTDISYSATGSFLGYDASINPVETGIPYRVYQANGRNKAFQYIFNNALDDNPYKSPYNFYPVLFDISNIEFTTNVTNRAKPSENGIESSVWNKNYNDPSNNWIVSIYTRPRYTGPNKTNPGFDRFNSITYVVSNNGTLSNLDHNFTLVSSFQNNPPGNIIMNWSYTENTSYTWTNLLNTKINSESPYGNIEYIGDQQIMSIAILTNYVNFVGKIKKVLLNFKDGRTITMV